MVATRFGLTREISVYLLSQDEMRLRWLMKNSQFDSGLDANEAAGVVVGTVASQLAEIFRADRNEPGSCLVICSEETEGNEEEVSEMINVQRLELEVQADYQGQQGEPNCLLKIPVGAATFLKVHADKRAQTMEMAIRLALRLSQVIWLSFQSCPGVVRIQNPCGELRKPMLSQ